MSTDSKKWKPNLLSSGVPFEYEVSKLVDEAGFGVNADYTYHRRIGGEDVECSVDIRANRYTIALPDSERVGCLFDVLLECKYRTRKTAWLFLPDPSTSAPTRGHCAVRGIDNFSEWFLTDYEWWTKPLPFATCYKGVEVDTNNGHVQTAEIRHGLAQLQFAIPSLISSRLDGHAGSALILNKPILFTAILVTNVPLRIASGALSPAQVEAANDLDALSTPVECLVVSYPAGQDFYRHAQRHFAGMPSIIKRRGFVEAEQRKKEVGVTGRDLPTGLAERLESSGEEIERIADVSCILVSTARFLPELLGSFREMADRVVSSAKRKWPDNWGEK